MPERYVSEDSEKEKGTGWREGEWEIEDEEVEKVTGTGGVWGE